MSLIIDKQQTKTVIDSLTGEIISEVIESNIQQINKKVSREQFFMVYAKVLSILYGDTLSGATHKVFWWLLETYPGLYSSLGISKAVKDEICKVIGVTLRTVDTALKELVDSSLLIKSGRATFKINPEFVWKGNLEERSKLLQFNIYTDE